MPLPDPQTQVDILTAMDQLVGEGFDPEMSTGFNRLDKHLGGLHRKDLVIIGSRSGMGKTALALDIAWHVAVDEKRSVLIFSPVTTSEVLTHRFLSAMGSLDPLRLRNGHLDQHEQNRMETTAKKLLKAHLLYVPGMPLTPETIREEATRIGQRHGAIDLIIVDDMELIVEQPTDSPSSYTLETRAADLKQIARDLDLAVLATMTLEQVSRDGSDPRPRLADQPGDGLLESIADAVVVLHREHAYDPVAEASGLGELYVVKNSRGPCTHPRNPVRLSFTAPFARFADQP